MFAKKSGVMKHEINSLTPNERFVLLIGFFMDSICFL